MSPRLPVVVTRRAERQIEKAAGWWLDNRPAAPDALHDELRKGFDLIATNPNLGARAEKVSLQGVRRIYLSRVRYHLYYRSTASFVEVLAFWHTSRGSGPPL